MDEITEYPFDMNEFWERKMWWWLENNIENLNGKILFCISGRHFNASNIF